VLVVRLITGWLAQRISYRILSGYAVILGTMLLVLLLAISRLAAYSDSVVQSINQASPHIQLGSAVAQQIATTRLRVAQYLRTQAPVDYNAATDALDQLGASIDDALTGLSDPEQIDPLKQVQASYITYVNTFRNLVAVIAKREQQYIQLLSLQTAIETRLYQLQRIGFMSPLDASALEACNQIVAHVQLASSEFTVLRLQPRPDSVIWLRSELSQIQLWFDVLSDHATVLSGEARELYRQVNERQLQFQQNGVSFLTLHERDERQARDSLEQVGTQLEQRSNVVLNGILAALNTTVVTLSLDASASQRTLLLLLVVAGVLSVIASIVLTISLTNPLRDLSVVAQAIAAGDLAIRADTTRRDEIGQLAAAFNQMTDSLQRSLETERAANEQIRLQTAQIARQTQASAVMEERQRIARELHDSVKQQLFSISLSAGAALNLLSSDDPDAARNYLEHLKQASREAQAEMKNLLQELVPAPLQEHRLDEALDQYVQSLCKVHRLQLTWAARGVNTLPITHEHALFRAAQEAIANVIRHSGATRLCVSLDFGSPTTLVVEDDGCGFDPDDISPGSSGLSMMRSRLERVGGVVDVRSTPGRGTHIEMTVNLEANEIGAVA